LSGFRWKGRHFWGVCAKDQLFHSSVPRPIRLLEKKVVIMSRSEDSEIIQKLGNKLDVKFSSGAGYKVLCVILGLADLYVLSKDSTHFWDTCGPHAILRALGGGIKSFKDLIESSKTERSFVLRNLSKELTYVVDEENLKNHFKNNRGVYAYRDIEVVEPILDCL